MKNAFVMPFSMYATKGIKLTQQTNPSKAHIVTAQCAKGHVECGFLISEARRHLNDEPREGRQRRLDSGALEANIGANPTITVKKLSGHFNVSHREMRTLWKVSKVGMQVLHDLSAENCKERDSYYCASLHSSQLQEAGMRSGYFITMFSRCASGLIMVEGLFNSNKNREVYCQQLKNLNEALGKKITTRVPYCMNDRRSVGRIRQRKIFYPPCSSDIAVSDFYLLEVFNAIWMVVD